jgi:nucleotide-binding universal stress UspA family protein
MKILIGVDGSPQGLSGARLVATLPLSASDEVIAASVVERPVLLGAWSYAVTDLTGSLYDEAWSAAARDAREATEGAASVLATLPSVVRKLTREGHPVAMLQLLVRELDADLLVVGPRGLGRIDSILLGSVSQSLLQSMPTSILVSREPVRVPQRILLAFDGSPHSLAAVRFLAKLPLPAEARIDVLTSTGARAGAFASSRKAELHDFEVVAEQHAAEVTRQAVDVLRAVGRPATPHVRHGDPKLDILAAAHDLDSDLIVVGARGVGGFQGMILGSVSRAVSKAAPCSTLVAAHRAGAGRQA